MRLADAILRQGHLSERALTKALMTGDRPAHLDHCDVCATRLVDLGRWLDDVCAVSIETADLAFPSERLAAQHAEILRRLEQLDKPSRVITFPSTSPTRGHEMSSRRVATAWVGIAAAAGLVIGVVWGARMDSVFGPPLAAPASAEASSPAQDLKTSSSSIFDLDLDAVAAPSLAAINDLTPRMTGSIAMRSAR